MWTPLIPFTKALNMLERDHGEILSRKRRVRERRSVIYINININLDTSWLIRNSADEFWEMVASVLPSRHQLHSGAAMFMGGPARSQLRSSELHQISRSLALNIGSCVIKPNGWSFMLPHVIFRVGRRARAAYGHQCLSQLGKYRGQYRFLVGALPVRLSRHSLRHFLHRSGYGGARIITCTEVLGFLPAGVTARRARELRLLVPNVVRASIRAVLVEHFNQWLQDAADGLQESFRDPVDANQWTCSGILKGLLAVFIYVLPYTLLHTYQNLLDPLVP